MTRCTSACCRGYRAAPKPAPWPRLRRAMLDWRGLVVLGVLIALALLV